MKTVSFTKPLYHCWKWLFEHLPSGLVCLYGAIIAFLVFSSAIELGIGTEDIAMLKVFSYDEPHTIELLQLNLENNDLNPRGFFNYGYFYQTLAYVILNIYRSIGFDVSSSQLLVFTTRGLSLVAYVFLLIIFERTLRAHGLAPSTRLAFTAYLAAMPTLYRWGHFTHPDVLQLALAMAVVWVLCFPRTLARFFLAGLIAGLSFGTKAPGIFLLVLIGSTYLFEKKVYHQIKRNWTESIKVMGAGIIILSGFVICWLGTNTYILKYPHLFFEDFRYERIHVSVGHGRVENTPAIYWVERLVKELSPSGTWIIGIGILLLLLVIIIISLRKSSRDMPDSIKNHFVVRNPALCFGVAVYVSVYLLFLVVQVDLKQARYLLAVLPFIIWLAAIGYTSFLGRRQVVSVIIIPFCMLYPTIVKTKDTCSLSVEALHKERDERIIIGRWIQGRYSGNTKIVAERYSYIPPDTTNVTYIDRSIDAGVIKQFKPDVLVITRKQSGRFVWKKPKTQFKQRKFKKGDYSKADHFYKFFWQIFSRDSNWRVVKEGRDMVVLERKDKYNGIQC
jgi:hypothetical protein